MTITQSGRLASIWVVPQDIPVPLYFYTMGFFVVDFAGSCTVGAVIGRPLDETICLFT